MACCCPNPLTAATGRFFSRFARRYRKRYARKGLERTQRQLVAGLDRAGFAGAALLEIGSGVGYLHHQLLARGAASAFGVEMAAGMLAEARASAQEQGLGGQVSYREGDFVELAPDVPPADVVLLDKVICCYPDARNLVALSLARARRVYAFTIPRDLVINHIGVRLMGFFFWLFGSPFRNYVHDPELIGRWLTDAGFRRTYDDHTLFWLTRVYVRA
jgi:magnesium-protoporphyrin O-methyltransferase